MSAYSFSKEGEGDVNETTVFNFHGSLKNAPVQDYYIDQLAAAGVKHEFTVPQLTPVLQAQGIDVNALSKALQPTLNAAELATLTTLLANPIPIKYTLDVDTHIQVEPTTGAIVNLQRINKTLYVRPDPNALSPLEQVLNKHQNVPAAKAALTGLNKVKTGEVGRDPGVRRGLATGPNALRVDDVAGWSPVGGRRSRC